jgi:hypothetical protein
VSPTLVTGVEAGAPSSIDGYVRLALALSLRPTFALSEEDDTRARHPSRDVDPVHAAMGEAEASHLRAHGFEVYIDEPFQHYHFAGRADLVAVDRERHALLHIENKSRFPDLGGWAGSLDTKRDYLAGDLVRRLGPPSFTSQAHVTVALWSSEVLHSLRIRRATFDALCPDPPDAFAAWWTGAPPAPGTSRTLVILDPLVAAGGRARQWVGIEASATVRPRYRGYVDALARLRATGGT